MTPESDPEPGDAGEGACPWLEREEWSEGRVRSGGRGELVAVWFATAVWAALTAPLAWVVFPEQWAEGTIWAWVVLAFGLLGVWIVVHAARTTLRWRRFGDLILELDPFPGSPGGDVGGSVVVPLRSHQRPELRVALSCVLSEVRGSGRGRTRWETVQWTRAGVPRVEPATGGMRVRFTFRVPEDLPPTGEPSERYHRWMVRLTGRVPGADLDVTFEVPVYDGDGSHRAADPAPVSETEAPGRELPASVVRVEPAREGVRLRYPPGRDRRAGVLLTVFGAVFGGMAAGMGFFLIRQASGTSGSLFLLVAGFGALLLGGFLLLGLVLVGAGLYTLVNRLEVTLSDREIVAVRRLAGIPFRRTAAPDEVERVELSISGQTGQGARARPTYDLRAFTRDGSRLCLGDGIHGPDVAEGVARIVEEETGLEVERVPRGERTSGIAWRKARRRASRASSTGEG